MSYKTQMILWFAGAFFAGRFVYTIFGMQIGIINNCAMKMFNMIRNDTEFFYPDACLSYFNKVKRRNRIIIFVIFAIVICLLPLIGIVGFIAGYILRKLFTLKLTGINDNNISDSIDLFVKFAKPGMEEEMREGLSYIAMQLKFKSIYQYT